MIRCPKCRRKFSDESIDPEGVLCPGCGAKVERPPATGVDHVQAVDDSPAQSQPQSFGREHRPPSTPFETGNITVGKCSRCAAALPASQLLAVPLVLRIVAFPLILLALLHHPWNIGHRGRELVDKYCPRCRIRQMVCYIVVGIWCIAGVIVLICEQVNKSR
jgi:hypothetical protein